MPSPPKSFCKTILIAIKINQMQNRNPPTIWQEDFYFKITLDFQDIWQAILLPHFG